MQPKLKFRATRTIAYVSLGKEQAEEELALVVPEVAFHPCLYPTTQNMLVCQAEASHTNHAGDDHANHHRRRAARYRARRMPSREGSREFGGSKFIPR